MRLKMRVIFLLLVSITVVGIGVAESNSSPNTSIVAEKQTAISEPVVDKFSSNLTDKPSIINGAEKSELIPDSVAYSLMFRFISGDQTASAKKRIRSYIKLFGEEDQLCSMCQGQMKDVDIDIIIAAADEYQHRVSLLDGQAEQIKRNNPRTISSEAMVQLRQLQLQKEALITEIVSSLDKRLSTKGSNKLKSHVMKRVKARTKYKPNTSQNLEGLVGSVR